MYSKNKTGMRQRLYIHKTSHQIKYDICFGIAHLYHLKLLGTYFNINLVSMYILINTKSILSIKILFIFKCVRREENVYDFLRIKM